MLKVTCYSWENLLKTVTSKLVPTTGKEEGNTERAQKRVNVALIYFLFFLKKAFAFAVHVTHRA